MHYFEWHIGDYRAATAHLSNAEDLAYRRLLDMYYDTEQPIENNLPFLARRLRVEPAAIEAVLSDFFTLEDGFWRHARCDERLGRYSEKKTGDDARKENVRERQRRHRELRAQLFEQLREAGIVPLYDTQTETLKMLVESNHLAPVTPPVTRDIRVSHALTTAITNNQQPITNNQELIKTKDQSTAQAPTSAKPPRFDPKTLAEFMPVELGSAWERWITYRRERKLSTKEPTWRAQAAKLTEWGKQGHNPVASIDASIMNGWAGLFEPKQNNNYGNGNHAANKPKSSLIDRFIANNYPQPPEPPAAQ
jgi:uncharacterized protein YdaU (DUF1376 family)